MAKGIKTGGRKPGSRNKRSHARQQAFAATQTKIEKALGKDVFKGDAHAFMVATYKNTSLPLALRLDAARAAAPYEKQRLSATTLQGTSGAPVMPDGGPSKHTRTVIDKVREMLEEEMRKPRDPVTGELLQTEH